MKHIIALLIPLSFLFFTACGGDKEDPPIHPSQLTDDQKRALAEIHGAADAYRRALASGQETEDGDRINDLIIATLLFKAADNGQSYPRGGEQFLVWYFKNFINDSAGIFPDPFGRANALARANRGACRHVVPRFGQVSGYLSCS